VREKKSDLAHDILHSLRFYMREIGFLDQTQASRPVRCSNVSCTMGLNSKRTVMYC
jgi:hypothetical protein